MDCAVIGQDRLRQNRTARESALVSRASDVFSSIVAGRLSVRVGGRYSFDEAALAHEDLEGRRTTGKLLLVS